MCLIVIVASIQVAKFDGRWKDKANLFTTKGLEGGNYYKKYEKLRDTQITSDLGTPLPQCLFVIVYLIQLSQIGRIWKSKANLRKRKSLELAEG